MRICPDGWSRPSRTALCERLAGVPFTIHTLWHCVPRLQDALFGSCACMGAKATLFFIITINMFYRICISYFPNALAFLSNVFHMKLELSLSIS